MGWAVVAASLVFHDYICRKLTVKSFEKPHVS